MLPFLADGQLFDLGGVLPQLAVSGFQLIKQLMVGAPALNPLWLNFAVLGGWLVVLFGVGVKFWRWE